MDGERCAKYPPHIKMERSSLVSVAPFCPRVPGANPGWLSQIKSKIDFAQIIQAQKLLVSVGRINF